MSSARRVRVTVTLRPALVAKVDRTARAAGATRSSVVERWLERAAREQARQDLEAAIADYYDRLTEEERAEDAAWAKVATASFARREGGARASRRRR